jgi:hypothetical protein
MPPAPDNWRSDSGLTAVSLYRKRFALFPVKCSGGESVTFKFYYKKYTIWTHGNPSNLIEDTYRHTDFIENITEAEYIIRKLAETL